MIYTFLRGSEKYIPMGVNKYHLYDDSKVLTTKIGMIGESIAIKNLKTVKH